MGIIALNFKLFGVSLVAASFLRTPVAYYAVGASFASLAALIAYYNMTSEPHPPHSGPVPAGKTRICVAGFTHSAPTARAHYLADKIVAAHPDKFESWYYWDTFAFYKFTIPKFEKVTFPAHLKGHSTSPFVWLEEGANNTITPIGGCDHFSEWVKKNDAITAVEPKTFANGNWSPLHYITGESYHVGQGAEPTTK